MSLARNNISILSALLLYLKDHTLPISAIIKLTIFLAFSLEELI